MSTRCRRFKKRFLCELLGWHRLAKGTLGFDGASNTGYCSRCGKRILQDSQGNWFEAAAQSTDTQHCDHICKICGKHEDGCWANPTKNEIIEMQLCFTCHFWQEKLEARKKNDPRAVVVKGGHYYIHYGQGATRGHGGRKFKIKFHDGRVVECSDLWYQGKIPERFRDVLTDNAEFVPTDEDIRMMELSKTLRQQIKEQEIVT